MVVVGLFGPPGSGKTQIANELCANHGFEKLIINSMKEEDVSCNMSFQDLNIHDDHTFSSLQEAADFGTTCWKNKYVLLGIPCSEEAVDLFKKRPIFVLMYVMCPLSERCKRLPDLTIEDLIMKDDGFTCKPQFMAMQEVSKIVLNNDGSLDEKEFKAIK